MLGLRPSGLEFESCVWRAVSSRLSHHPQEVLLAQFSLYVHKGGLKPYSFHLLSLVIRISQDYAEFILKTFIVINLLIFILKISSKATFLFSMQMSPIPPPPLIQEMNHL